MHLIIERFATHNHNRLFALINHGYIFFQIPHLHSTVLTYKTTSTTAKRKNICPGLGQNIVHTPLSNILGPVTIAQPLITSVIKPFFCCCKHNCLLCPGGCWREAALLNSLGHRTATEKIQLVQIHTRNRQAVNTSQILHKAFQRLPRQTKDNIHNNGSLVIGANQLQPFHYCFLGIQTTTGLTNFGIKGLNPNGHPIYPIGKPSLYPLLLQIVNTSLHSDFTIIGQRNTFLQLLQYLGNIGWR